MRCVIEEGSVLREELKVLPKVMWVIEDGRSEEGRSWKDFAKVRYLVGAVMPI